MKFACEGCHAQYMISDEKVGPRGVKVRCKKCNHVNVVRRPAPAVDPDANPAPAPQRPAGSLDDELGAAFAYVTGGTPGPETAIAPTRLEGPAPDESPFGGNEFDAAIGDLERTRIIDNPELQRIFEERDREHPASAAPPAAEASTPAEALEWYVAVDDQQIGPIPFDDVRSRWEGGSIGPDTLCWRTGMADWSPLSQVQELADALAPRPSAPVVGGAAADSSWLTAAMTPQETPAPSWKPSAASALADLVEAELEAAKKAAVPSEATLERDLPAIESTSVRSLLKELPRAEAPAPELSRLLPLSGLPGATPAEPAPAAVSAPAPAGPAPAAPAPAAHAPAQKSGGAGKWIAVAAAVLVLAGGGAYAAGLFGGGSQPQPSPMVAQAQAPAALVPAAPPAPPPAAPVPTESATEPTAAAAGAGGADGAAGAPGTASAAPAAVAAVDPVEDTAKKLADAAEAKAKALAAAEEPVKVAAAPARATKPARSKTASTTRRQQPAPAPRETPSSSGDLLDAAGNTSSIDSLFDSEFKRSSQPKPKSGGGSYIPPAPGGGGKPHQLSQGDIAGVVVGHKGALKTCATSYKDSSGKDSGTVVMRWTIRPNGSTTGVQPVKGGEHKQLANCIGGLVKTWKFPAYGGPQMAPIDFPFQF